jgi:hypothetical protein
MHTATRLAARLIPKVRSWNPTAAYGLYAPIYLRHLGVQTVLGGEFEEGLAALAQRLECGVEVRRANSWSRACRSPGKISSSPIVRDFLPLIGTPI